MRCIGRVRRTSLPAYESWMPPVFSLTVAAFTTAVTTVKEKEAWRPPRGVGGAGRTSGWSIPAPGTAATPPGPVS